MLIGISWLKRLRSRYIFPHFLSLAHKLLCGCRELQSSRWGGGPRWKAPEFLKATCPGLRCTRNKLLFFKLLKIWGLIVPTGSITLTNPGVVGLRSKYVSQWWVGREGADATSGAAHHLKSLAGLGRTLDKDEQLRCSSIARYGPRRGRAARQWLQVKRLLLYAPGPCTTCKKYLISRNRNWVGRPEGGALAPCNKIEPNRKKKDSSLLARTQLTKCHGLCLLQPSHLPFPLYKKRSSSLAVQKFSHGSPCL